MLHSRTVAERLRIAASSCTAPRDVVVRVTTGDEGEVHEVAGNSLLMSIASDYFCTALKHEWRSSSASSACCGYMHVLDVAEVDADDVGMVVRYSEGDGPGWDDAGAWLEAMTADQGDHRWRDVLRSLLRVQARFIVPGMRAACAAALRSVTTALVEDAGACPGVRWQDVAEDAAEQDLWDVVADAVVLASRAPWMPGTGLPGGASLSEPLRSAPAEVVADVIRRGEFLYQSQRVLLAMKWATSCPCACEPSENPLLQPEGAPVIAMLAETCASNPLWLCEVECVVPSDSPIALPSCIVAGLMRSLATDRRGAARMWSKRARKVSLEARSSMAMVEASIQATQGSGTYQMALVPAAPHLRPMDAYVSSPVRLEAGCAYHVYLEEDARLQAWWKRTWGGVPNVLHVLLAFAP